MVIVGEMGDLCEREDFVECEDKVEGKSNREREKEDSYLTL